MSIKVLLTKALLPVDLDYMSSKLDPSVDIVKPSAFDEDSIISAMEGIDVMLGGMVTDNIGAAANHVGFFQIPWTGVDALNFECIEKHNLTVCNSHSNSSVVAEHAVAMWLSLAKKLPYHDSELRKGIWNRVNPNGNEVSPFSKGVSGTKVLLVGCGAIGSDIAKLIQGFGCEISVVTRSGKCSLENYEQCFSFDQLDKALVNADSVFLSVPLTESTVGLFGEKQFEKMRQSALFINISRGATVDESSLFNALHKHVITGAAIDTWYKYPSAKSPATHPSVDYPFQDLKNLVMSPHRAGYTDSGFPHLDDAIENINRYVKNEPLIHVISNAKGY